MMVLIGVILFSALAYTFMRSGRQGISNVSSQESAMISGDIIAYAVSVERGVSRMRMKGVSEFDLDFVGAGATYDNTNCSEAKCEVFSAQGGQQAWQATVNKANDATPWQFTGAVSVADVGNDDGDAKSSELIMALSNINFAICMDINRKLGIENPSDEPPVSSGSPDFSTAYTGTFSAGSDIGGTELDGKRAACFENGGSYYFYQVLLAR